MLRIYKVVVVVFFFLGGGGGEKAIWRIVRTSKNSWLRPCVLIDHDWTDPATGSSDLFLILGCMTSNLLVLELIHFVF